MSSPSPAERPDTPSLAIVELYNRSGESLPRWDEACETQLHEAFLDLRGLRILDRTTVSVELLRRQLAPSRLVGYLELASKFGNSLHADWLLTGTVLRFSMDDHRQAMTIEMVILDVHQHDLAFRKVYSAVRAASSERKLYRKLFDDLIAAFRPDFEHFVQAAYRDRGREPQPAPAAPPILLAANQKSNQPPPTQPPPDPPPAEAPPAPQSSAPELQIAISIGSLDILDPVLRGGGERVQLIAIGRTEDQRGSIFAWPADSSRQVPRDSHIALAESPFALPIGARATPGLSAAFFVIRLCQSDREAERGIADLRASRKPASDLIRSLVAGASPCEPATRYFCDNEVLLAVGSALRSEDFAGGASPAESLRDVAGRVQLDVAYRRITRAPAKRPPSPHDRSRAVDPTPPAPSTKIANEQVWVEHDATRDEDRGMLVLATLGWSSPPATELSVEAHFPFDTGLARSTQPGRRVDRNGHLSRSMRVRATKTGPHREEVAIFVPYTDFDHSYGLTACLFRVEVRDASGEKMLARSSDHSLLLRKRT